MKNAFTLIELIAVIVLLAIIVLAVTPAVTNTLNASKEKLNKTQINQLESAARNWGITGAKVSEDGTATPNFITIDELQKSGYLEDDTVKDLTDKTNLSKTSKICITYKDNQFIYTYKGEKNCEK